MSERIERIKTAVELSEKCRATHVQSLVVKERLLNTIVVWEGVIETFKLHDHPTAKLAYAWEAWKDGRKEEPEYPIVLGIPPVNSPNDAIKAYVAAGAKEMKRRMEERKKNPATS